MIKFWIFFRKKSVGYKEKIGGFTENQRRGRRNLAFRLNNPERGWNKNGFLKKKARVKD